MIKKGLHMNRYRCTFIPFTPWHGPEYNYGMVIYHDKTNGATPSSCNWIILDIDDRWNSDIG
jgi:hypothetical protein